jgi:predicted nucleic acid-binding protein
MEKLIDSLVDTNVFSQIFKGNLPVKQFVENLSPAVDATIYIENLQGSKSNQEKVRIKKYLKKFNIFYQTEEISRRAVALIEQYSNTHGLLLADAQIAAVCLEYDLTLITYNTKDFQFIAGLKITVPPYPTV